MANLLTQLKELDAKVASLDNFSKRCGKLLERHVVLIQAVIELLGNTAVQEKVNEIETRAFLAQFDADVKEADAAVEAGTHRKSERVEGDKDFVVISVKNADGSPATPDRNAALLTNYVPSMRDKLKDAAVGAEITEGEQVVTVMAVYTPVVTQAA